MYVPDGEREREIASIVAMVMITAHEMTPTASNLVRPTGNLGSSVWTYITQRLMY